MDKETAPKEENTKLPVWLAKKYFCTARSLWDRDAGVWESPGLPFPSQYEGSPWLGFFKYMHKPQPIPGELCLVDLCECVCVCVSTCVCTYVHMHEQAHLYVLVCAYVYFPNYSCIIGIFFTEVSLVPFPIICWICWWLVKSLQPWLAQSQKAIHRLKSKSSHYTIL